MQTKMGGQKQEETQEDRVYIEQAKFYVDRRKSEIDTIMEKP